MRPEHQRPLMLFKKLVHQSPAFTQQSSALGIEVTESIVEATSTFYPRFRRLRHGLVLGQIETGRPESYEGPSIQFIYKVMATKVFFASLRVDGFSQEEIDAVESLYDL